MNSFGGSHSPESQVLDLSRLGLADGDPYTLSLFHAERQTNGSNFRLQTNVLLEDATTSASISGPWD